MLQSNTVNLKRNARGERDSNGQCGRQLCFEEGVWQHPGGDSRTMLGEQRLVWDFYATHLNQGLGS